MQKCLRLIFSLGCAVALTATLPGISSGSTPDAAALDLAGADDPVLAGIQYQITAVYSDADGYEDLSDLFLAIDRDGVSPPSSPDDILFHATQGAASSGTATIDAGSAFLTGSVTYSKAEGSPTANDISVTWTFTLDWDWFEDSPGQAEYGVRATDDSAGDSGWDYTNIDVTYENDLDFSGTISAVGAANGPVTCGSDWVQGSEGLTWTGLTVVYEGSSISPADADFDIQITDDDTGIWTQTTGSSLGLATSADASTDVSDIHTVDITGIPSGGSDVSNVTCEIRVDADIPEDITGLSAGSPTVSSVTLSWNPYDAGDAGAIDDSGFKTYRVYYSQTAPVTTGDPVWDFNDDPALLSSLASTTVITGLDPGTTYYFRIVGLDQAENPGDIDTATETNSATIPAVGSWPAASASDIVGANDTVYPGIRNHVTAYYSDSDGSSDLADLFLRLDHDSATDIIFSVTQGQNPAGTATVIAGSAYLIGDVTYNKKEGFPASDSIEVTWSFTLDWDWTESGLIEYGVRATDDSTIDSGWDYTDIDVLYENDLDFTGTLSASGAVNGALVCGNSWVQGAEGITWSGLFVVYEGSSVSPADTDFDIRITDDDTGIWTQTSGSALNLMTTGDSATDPSDIHNLEIIGIPSGGSDVSAESCEIKTDSSAPETITGLSAGSSSDTYITLSWNAYTSGDSGASGDSGFKTYRVYYSASTPVTNTDSIWDVRNDAALASVTTSTTTLTGLDPETTYYFRIAGLDKAENEGSLSAATEASGTTQSPEPTANNDTYTTNEDIQLNVSPPGVLDNDSDAQGDKLSAVLVNGPANGSLILTTHGSFTYRPNPTFNGTDSFTYKASDGVNDSNIATATITVNAVNYAPTANNDQYSTDMNTTLTVPAPGVLENDTDVRNDPLTAQLISGPSYGTLTLNTNGSFVYAPNPGSTSVDYFTYVANDGNSSSGQATVTIPIYGPYHSNGQPVINAALNVTGKEDIPIDIVLTAFDPDYDHLTFLILSNPAHGIISGTPPYITYTPDADFYGTDSFTYEANDGFLDSNTGIAYITVEAVSDQPPVAQNDTYTGTEPGLAVNAPGVLANDTNNDGPWLKVLPMESGLATGGSTMSLTDAGAAWTSGQLTGLEVRFISGANNGEVRYIDNNSNDTFSWSTPLPVSVSVGDRYLMYSQFTRGLPPLHGHFKLNEDGSFTLSDADDVRIESPCELLYDGTNTFSYEAFDGTYYSNLATVTIELEDDNPPTAVNDTYSVNEDAELNVPLPGVVQNDIEPDPEILIPVLVTGPSSGTLVLSNCGDFMYVPDPDYYGTDTFTYRASDGFSESSNTATVSITVNSVNDQPTISDIQNQAIYQNTSTAAIPFTVGDKETPAGNLTIAAVSSNITLVRNTDIVIGGSGTNRTVTVTPESDQYGTADIVITVSDGSAEASDSFLLSVSSTTAYYCDDDSDGYFDSSGDGTCDGYGCEPQGCQRTSGNDCNDSDININPETLWYPDFDGDGYGNPTVSIQQCLQPSGYVLDNTDCDDNDQYIYPGGDPVRISRATPSYHSTLQGAYNNAADGDSIQCKDEVLVENPDLNRNISVAITGGYDCSYSSTTGVTTINGNMIVNNGQVTIENIVLE